MVDSGIILLKYWLEVSPDEQTRRLQGRIDDPRKVWKLSELDLLSYTRWHDYSRARDDMFAATDTAWAPWFVVTPTTRSAPGSTSSPICWRRCRTNRCRSARSSCPSARSARPGAPGFPLHWIPTPF